MINFLKNLFKWRISIKSNIIYIEKDVKMYVTKCEQCNKGYWNLPNHKGKKYIYKFIDDGLSIEMQNKIENDNFKVYGWVIQERYKKTKDGWYDAHNHKVYFSKLAALDAINQIDKSSNGWYTDRYEYRVRPVYHLDDITSRNLLIQEILKKEK